MSTRDFSLPLLNMSSTNEPEQYPVHPTPHCPNSVFPVLVYRGVLPTPVDEESTSEFLQRNHWEKKASHENIWNTQKKQNSMCAFHTHTASTNLSFSLFSSHQK